MPRSDTHLRILEYILREESFTFMLVLPQICQTRMCPAHALCASPALGRALPLKRVWWFLTGWKYSPALPRCLTLTVDYKRMFSSHVLTVSKSSAVLDDFLCLYVLLKSLEKNERVVPNIHRIKTALLFPGNV